MYFDCVDNLTPTCIIATKAFLRAKLLPSLKNDEQVSTFLAFHDGHLSTTTTSSPKLAVVEIVWLQPVMASRRNYMTLRDFFKESNYSLSVHYNIVHN